MIAHEPRTLGYYAASHWFQSAVVFLLLGLLALILLRALNDMEARAERQTVELTVRNMQTGMHLAMAEALMRQREGEIVAWAGSNPTRWLEVPPAGYRGECTADERRKLPEGAWCFERDSGQLVYQPRNADQLRSMDDGRPCRQLVWRVVRLSDSEPVEGFFRTRIHNDSTCAWSDGEKVGK